MAQAEEATLDPGNQPLDLDELFNKHNVKLGAANLNILWKDLRIHIRKLVLSCSPRFVRNDTPTVIHYGNFAAEIAEDLQRDRYAADGRLADAAKAVERNRKTVLQKPVAMTRPEAGTLFKRRPAAERNESGPPKCPGSQPKPIRLRPAGSPALALPARECPGRASPARGP